MSKISDFIDKSIAEGKVNYNVKLPEPKKKSLLVRLALYPWEILKIFLGIDADSINRGTTKTDYTSKSSESTSFRANNRVDNHINHTPNSYTFDPVAVANLKIYLEGLDGKGDNECGHSHDDD